MFASVTAVEHAIAICQHVVGEHIDKAVGQLLVESVTPLALEVTLAVQQELQARVDESRPTPQEKQVERGALRKPIWLSAAISMSIPRTVSSQIRSRRTGMKSSVS